MKYLDPPNAAEIIEKIKTLPTIGDVKLLAEEIFPNWYVSSTNAYSKDYPQLTENWKIMCEATKSARAQIFLVDEVCFDDDHTIIRMFAECFTRAGFSVRRKREYNECSKCGCAIPSVELWSIFKEKGSPVPLVWSLNCTECV